MLHLQMSEDVNEVAKRDPPRIQQTTLIIEKKPVCKTTNFTQALSVWFVSHYVFDLVYSKQTRDVALFFQEFMFGLPEKGSSRATHSATYLTVSSDITKFL